MFVAVREDGAILLRKRRDKGLLAGMSEVPNSGFTSRSDGDRSIGAAPFAASWKKAGMATHVFTHFRLELTVFRCDVNAAAVPPGWWWSEPHAIGSEALPTVMHKAIGAAGIRTGRSNLAGKSRENQ